MKWNVFFVDGLFIPDGKPEGQLIEADNWSQSEMWVHFYRSPSSKPDEKLVASFRADLLRSIELVE